ncbi:hypothetical protein AB1N83_002529 [Pleurotus pulmonarius]
MEIPTNLVRIWQNNHELNTSLSTSPVKLVLFKGETKHSNSLATNAVSQCQRKPGRPIPPLSSSIASGSASTHDNRHKHCISWQVGVRTPG